MKSFKVWFFLLLLVLIGVFMTFQSLSSNKLAVATFAGGCFWCMEHPYDELEGVKKTIVGYTSGHVVDPSYEQVSSGSSGHREAIEVHYDPDVVSYEVLLDVFWRNIDPTDDGGQFCDRGFQYSSAIFFHNEEQRRLAEASVVRLSELDFFKASPIVTSIEAVSEFYRGEEYHQEYYRKNPVRYKLYRYGCGRDKRLDEIWGGI